jgi:hypothetical protein
MDPIVAEHPEIEPPDDRVESWQILPGKSDGRRPRGPEQELRIAQQNPSMNRNRNWSTRSPFPVR